MIDINNNKLCKLFNAVKYINDEICSFKLTTNYTFRTMHQHIENNEDKNKMFKIRVEKVLKTIKNTLKNIVIFIPI